VESQELARAVARFALEKKAHDIIILDLRSLSDMTDFFVICHGDSDTHVKAIAESITDKMIPVAGKVHHQEGKQNLHWVLLDYVHVVAHIFLPATRQFYSLERLWGDAPMEEIHEDL